MVFSSPVFQFLFLPFTLLCYAAASRTGRMWVKNAALLFCSAVFYAYGGIGCLCLLAGSVVVNWLVGLLVDGAAGGGRRLWFLLGLAFNLGILFVFKYLNLIGDTGAWIAGALSGREVSSPFPRIVLPIGISFYTFQILSYQIDLYRKNVPCQRKCRDLALYVMLFPQLIAGPIVRYSDVRREIESRGTDLSDLYEGAFRYMVGFSKKVLLANSMGQAADLAFGLESGRGMPYAWLGIFCYSLQLYLDFWAYSDMAIGLGRVFGFHFPENFNDPYLSKSIQEFWRRWHITLSSWFRDYLYIPLGGSRKGLARTCVNLFVVFALTGLWHGASWSFLLWGIYFAVFLIAERLGLKKVLERLPVCIRRLYVLLVVGIDWVLFRAENLTLAAGYLRDMFSFSLLGTVRSRELAELALDRKFITLFVVSLLYCTPLFARLHGWLERKRLGIAADAVVLVTFFLSVCEMMAGGYNPFIYFRF